MSGYIIRVGILLTVLLETTACFQNMDAPVANTNVNNSILNTSDQAEWPPLPMIGFIKGRAATEKDVKDGNAVFVAAAPGGKVIGKPLNIEIPQYAEWNDEETGAVSRVIVIQAEKANDQELIGFVIIDTREQAVALSSELRLLGTTRQ